MLTVLLVALLSLVGSSSAHYRSWCGDETDPPDMNDHLWSTAANWLDDKVPTSADETWVHESSFHCLIDETVQAECYWLVVGAGSAGPDDSYLDITGGTLDVAIDVPWTGIAIGYLDDACGVVNMSAGVVTVGGHLRIGDGGGTNARGTLNMTGGTINLAEDLQIPGSVWVPPGKGTLHLDGGTINCKTLTMNTDGLIDVTGGRLIIDGNEVAAVNGYIASNWITASEAETKLRVKYDQITDTTTVTARDRNIAWGPSPYDESTNQSSDLILSWSPGDNAVSHDVYFGSSFADVNSATDPNGFTGRGRQTETAYSVTGGLGPEQTYYWRIDEVNIAEPNSPWKGDIWSFTTASWTNAQVSITPETRYQVFEGFGQGNMHQWTPLWYNDYNSTVRDEILDSFYTLDSNGLGLSICRFLMPVGDDPAHDHMSRLYDDCANAPFEPEDGIFTWDGHECLLWHAQGAVQRGAVMWAGWYSVPYWLTVSGCTAGSVDGSSNNLISGMEGRFAKHVCDVLLHFRDFWGVDFDYVSVTNEPEADWWVYGGGQPGCHVSSDQAIVMLRELHAALDACDLTPRIQAFDAAFSTSTGYLDDILQSDVEPNVSVLSCHQYSTTEPSLQIWDSRAVAYGKSLWQTEWGNWWDGGWPDDRPLEQAQSYADKIHEALKIMHANAWIIWEPRLIFDEEPEGLAPRKAYWPVAHYSRHIRPGMQLVESSESVATCKTTVWIEPNGPGKRRLVVVTYNNGDDHLQVEYDLSDFDGVEVVEVRRSRLNSYVENYQQVSFDAVEGGRFELVIAPKAIVTILAEFPGCTTFIPGDLTGPEGEPDCYIDFLDVRRLVQSWLEYDEAANLIDPNSQPSGYVNLFDLAEIANDWLECNDRDDPDCTWPGGG